MAANKTQPTAASVDDHLAAITPEARRVEAMRVNTLMREVTGEEPVLWGSGLVGFGRYQYKYASGREGEWFRAGFAARKTKLTLYLMPGFEGNDIVKRLGKVTHGKSCLHITKLSNIDFDVLRELVVASMAEMSERYPA